MKITALILTYNEEKRIRIAVSHALKWADEVCVVDIASSYISGLNISSSQPSRIDIDSGYVS